MAPQCQSEINVNSAAREMLHHSSKCVYTNFSQRKEPKNSKHTHKFSS